MYESKENGLETVVYLVRHCQSQPDAAIPECDWPLSDVGYAQAEALVDLLSSLNIELVFSSPFVRCVNTIGPFARVNKKEIVKDPRLRERKVAPPGVLDFADIWRRSWADFSFALEGCENSLLCQQRVVQSISDIVDQNRGKTIAICSHGSAIALFLNHVSGDFGLEKASKIRTPETIRVVYRSSAFQHDRTFSLGPTFDAIATDYRATPGIKA